MLVSLETARNSVLARLTPLEPISVSLLDALGGWAADELKAGMHLPPFDNSAMDGFAVRCSDFVRLPVQLCLTGTTPAGSSGGHPLGPGECMRVFTGAPIPQGADAVIMQEDAETVLSDPTLIQFGERPRPWDNIRFRGEDIQPETVLIRPGTRIAPQHLAILAASGHEEVRIHRRPMVSILTTGSELQPPGKPLAAGQIYESNRATVTALIAAAGGRTISSQMVPDDLTQVQSALSAAAAMSDLVLTIGGASVGEADFARSSVLALGGSIDLWKVSIRPGKPFFLGHIGNTPILGLPGNPVSAFVTAILLVLPSLRRLQGAAHCLPPTSHATLGESLNNQTDRDHYVRVTIDGFGTVRSAGVQASHRLASLALADGLVCVPAQSDLAAGRSVSVMTW